jgi:transcriptional regulator with XRE-family HTH domain
MRKPKPGHTLRVTSPAESLYIQFLLEAKRIHLKEIALALDLSTSTVLGALRGYHRSPRVEERVARILGRADWDEVVTEARQAIKYVTGTNFTPFGEGGAG